ncbi:sulfite reductase [Lysinibacillus sp. 54212]|uniref:sulfite reductase n=1 Tax=Lysinibacillus sp. 54212 TaxID=3119829 RepID=UPI002FC61071
MEELYRANFKQAMLLPMPEKTYAKLNKNDEYTCLTVRSGIINKHFTPQQFALLASLAEQGAVKYSANHSLLVSVKTEILPQIIEQLTVVGLYVVPPRACAVLKCCDFCDGDRLEALPIATELLNAFEKIPLKRRIRIGFNACTSACYNAVQDDVALVYHRGHFDLYAGAIPMGRSASSGKKILTRVPEAHIEEILSVLLELYNASQTEKFSTFIKRTTTLEGQLQRKLHQLAEGGQI